MPLTVLNNPRVFDRMLARVHNFCLEEELECSSPCHPTHFEMAQGLCSAAENWLSLQHQSHPLPPRGLSQPWDTGPFMSSKAHKFHKRPGYMGNIQDLLSATFYGEKEDNE